MSQQCSTCQHVSPEGAKFCPECGNPLPRVCRSCGHPSGGGKFCMECGAPTSDAAAPGAAPPSGSAPGHGRPISERRTTTVLFGDLVAFTTYSEGRDPEEVRELLSAYFARARAVMGRYGGTIEKFIGDAVMAVWGVPVSHEDDAERAVRAGLDLVSEIVALGETAGAPGLSMRVGIVTGSVAVTLGATNEGMVAGDAVNTAARVQTAASPGSVWVDPETRSLTQAAVAFSDMGEHALKGKAEPVRLYRADTVVAAVGGAQRVDGLQAPMVGREGELRAVKEALHATQADGRARLVVVTGVAGVGKSRLGWEFEKYTDGLSSAVVWHRGRSLSYGEGAAFWAFAEMIRSRLRILETDDRATVADKIAAGVRAAAAAEQEAAWLLPRVAALVSGNEAVSFERTDLFVAWTTFLERVGGADPVVLVFEDAQYADSGLVDLVEHLMQSIRCKLFVLVLARTELLERWPALVEGRGRTRVDLAPLSEEAMATLVDGLVAGLPVRARSALVDRAEGVPLYAVETVRSLIDQDAVVARDGRYVFVDHDHAIVDLERLTAPTSLQTLIAARLDALTATERRTAQDASVLGMTFRYGSLLALTGTSSFELDAALAGLVGKGVLETQDDPRSPELGQYRFLQAMVREVAYSTLARSDRRARHLAAAEQLTREETEGSEALAGIIAQHLLDALAASTETDPERPALAARARALLTTAATRAEGLGAPEEALANTLAALTLDPDDRERCDLQLRAARVAISAGRHAEGGDLATVAGRGYEALGQQSGLVSALSLQARAGLRQGRLRDPAQLAERADQLASGRDDVMPETRLMIWRVLGSCARATGDRAAQRVYAERGLLLAEETQDPALIIDGLIELAAVLLDLGFRSACRAIVERCMTLARASRHLRPLSRSLIFYVSEMYPDELGAAAEPAHEAVVVAKQVGDKDELEVAMTNACYLWLLAGDWDLLVAESAESIEGDELSASVWPLLMTRLQVEAARGGVMPVPALSASEDPYDEQVRAVVEGLACWADGDVEGAARIVAEASLRNFAGEATFEDFEVLWAPAVELQLLAGDLDAAERLLAFADPLLGGRGRALTRGEVPRLRGLLALARGEDPEADLREAEAALAAYGAPYLLARTRLELGRWLSGVGRAAEAGPLLAQARDTFVALGAVPSVAEVDEVVPSGVAVDA